MKRLLLAILFILGSALPAAAQYTTVSSTGVTDVNGVIYANGSYAITLINTTGQVPYFQGAPLPQGQQAFSGNLTSTGTFSVSIPSSAYILAGNNGPASKTTWQFTVCGQYHNGCYSATTAVSGATQNVTSTINSAAIQLTFSLPVGIPPNPSGGCITGVSATAAAWATSCGGGGGVTSFSGDGTFITNSASTGAVTATLSYPTLCTGTQFSQGFSSGSNNCATPSAGSSAFSAITTGTNTTATMTVGTGSSLTASGSGSITATAAPFSGISTGTNTTATMTVGTGGSVTTSGSGTIAATTATNLSSYPTLCSGGQFSQGLSSGSNNCATPSGSGTMTDGSGTTTAGYFPDTTTSAHVYAVDTNLDDGHTTANTLTYAGTAGITAPTFKTSASTAGLLALGGETSNPSLPSNSVGLLAPASASFTSYYLQFPSTAPSGTQYLGCGTPSSNVSTCSWTSGGGSGTVNSGTSGHITYYASSGTTVSSDSDLDDGATAANTLTYTGTSGVVAPQYKTSGTAAGLIALGGNTSNPSLPSASAGFLGPDSSSFTSYYLQLPTSAPSGTQYMGCGTPSSNVSTCAWASVGTLCGQLGVLSGTNFQQCSQFMTSVTQYNTNYFADGPLDWNIANVTGTGSLAQTTPTDTFTGTWELKSGATSTDETNLAAFNSAASANDGVYPPPSSTTKTFYIRFALGTDTDDRQTIGWVQANDTGLTSDPTANDEWFGCTVTDTASQGDYTCYMQYYSGGYKLTTMTTATTASDLNAHILKAVITTTELDIYYDGTKIACTNSGGTGGCTAWNTGLINTTLSPFVDTKTSTSASSAIILDKVGATW